MPQNPYHSPFAVPRLFFIILTCYPTLFAAQPNIFHILADDMGWNALSCYGNKWHIANNYAVAALRNLCEG